MSIERHISKSLAVVRKQPSIKRAITYISPNVTVKVTRQKRYRANAKQRTYLVSEGSPNFLERRALKAGKIKKYPLHVYEEFTA